MTAPAIWPVARLRQIGSGIWILAAALAVGGSFMPIIEYNRLYDEQYNARTITYTLWGNGTGDNDPFPMFGVPVMVGAALLAVAGVFGLISTRLHPASGPVLAARLLGVGGAGLLAGSLTIVFLLFEVFDRPESTIPEEMRSTVGFGVWVLIATALVAIGAIVLMLVPRLAKRGDEPETPAMGIPVVRVLEPEYDEEQTEHTEQHPVDPKG
nr:hypothetical protein [Kibdelosporangium sp. MJ126-NF4]CEL17020.1 hypothetical protein [Kibdelosporangium sp. MJ126-NF4]CTQ91750.1 hypothetical protein [Kibdelosporangium sp. MJ126-NF4]